MNDDTKVVDLNSRRLDKALENTGGFQRVQLICCSSCQSASFQLTHDNQIACAGCRIIIEPLRWYDVNQPPSPAA